MKRILCILVATCLSASVFAVGSRENQPLRDRPTIDTLSTKKPFSHHKNQKSKPKKEISWNKKRF